MSTRTPTPPRRRTPPRGRRPRWWPTDRGFLRWLVPLGVVVALFAVTVGAWAAERATPADPAFLEPASHAGVGSATLAGRLRAGGLPPRRYGDAAAAVRAAAAGHRTVLVTAPDLVDDDHMAALLSLPATDRVVLVAPSALLLRDHRLPVRHTGGRWATGVATAGCHARLATGGAAAVVGDRYRPGTRPATACYDGGLVVLPATARRPQLVLVGAADVFRNDRVGEHRNAALARSLLSGNAGLVWLCLHHREREAAPPVPDTVAPRPPTTEPTMPPRHDGTLPPPGATASGDPQMRPPDAGGGHTANPLWSTFPAWLWAVLLQLLLAAVLLTLWRARRLGRPTTEPLPVLVPAGETVTGRARMYARARARRAGLDALRAGALRRLVPMLDIGTDPAPELLVDTLSARSGWPADRVRATLFGTVPDTDEQLHAAVAALDLLVGAVHEQREDTSGGRTV